MTVKSIKLRTACDAILVPQGVPVWLERGTEVTVVQSLGGNVTVNYNGNLLRIAARDAYELGEENSPLELSLHSDATLEDWVWACLRTCYDPEIPVNIVDLGLVYDCRITELASGGMRVDVRMTLTAPGCGMGAVIAEDIKLRLESLKQINVANIEIVFDPPWCIERMSDAAKLELGLW